MADSASSTVTPKILGPYRKHIEEEIDRLVGILDTLDGDGDCDLEDNADDEPSLAGSMAQVVGGQILDDCEWDVAEYDSGDRIPGGGYHV